MRKTTKSAGRIEQVIFGAAIKRLRLKAGLTQKALGARIGRERSFISYIENGKQAIDLPVIFDLIEALGANPIEVLTEVYESPDRRKQKPK